jgi:hypothetical protein
MPEGIEQNKEVKETKDKSYQEIIMERRLQNMEGNLAPELRGNKEIVGEPSDKYIEPTTESDETEKKIEEPLLEEKAEDEKKDEVEEKIEIQPEEKAEIDGIKSQLADFQKSIEQDQELIRTLTKSNEQLANIIETQRKKEQPSAEAAPDLTQFGGEDFQKAVDYLTSKKIKELERSLNIDDIKKVVGQTQVEIFNEKVRKAIPDVDTYLNDPVLTGLRTKNPHLDKILQNSFDGLDFNTAISVINNFKDLSEVVESRKTKKPVVPEVPTAKKVDLEKHVSPKTVTPKTPAKPAQKEEVKSPSQLLNLLTRGDITTEQYWKLMDKWTSTFKPQ